MTWLRVGAPISISSAQRIENVVEQLRRIRNSLWRPARPRTWWAAFDEAQKKTRVGARSSMHRCYEEAGPRTVCSWYSSRSVGHLEEEVTFMSSYLFTSESVG